jgi:predicted outer membrane repeat protein
MKRILAVALLLLGAASTAQAGVIQVNALVDGGPGCTLRRAVANLNAQGRPNLECAAADGNDAILLAAGTHKVNSTILITRTAAFEGQGATTIVDGQNLARMFMVEITVGNPVKEVAFRKMKMIRGTQGALASADARIAIEDVSFESNFAQFDGGAIVMWPNQYLFIKRASFTNNTATTAGGAISSRGVVWVEDSYFGENQGTEGGAIFIQRESGAPGIPGDAPEYYGADLRVVRSTFWRNRGNGAVGGTIKMDQASGGLGRNTIVESQVNGALGGGVFGSGPVRLVGNYIVANSGGACGDVNFTNANVVSDGGNLVGVQCGFTPGPRDSITGAQGATGATPALNGGTTKTLIPATGADPRQRATCAPGERDQRGQLRRTHCDAGSYESTPAVAPGPPQRIVAGAADGAAFVQVVTPVNNGGIDFVTYAVTCGAVTVTRSVTDQATYGVTVAPLVNGVQVACRATATTVAGTSGPSTPDVFVRPARAPDPPTIGTATVNGRSVTVSFTPPAFNGGSEITSYRAECGSFSAAGQASPLTLVGLPGGAHFRCVVRAQNMMGQSQPSAAANEVAIAELPPGNLDGAVGSDLVFQNADGRVAAWLMNGSVITATSNLFGAGTGWTVTHVTDLNDDGKDDILFRHTDGRVYAYLMNGLTVIGGKELLPAGSGWSVSHVAGPILVLRHTDGRAHLWYMFGTDIDGSASLLPAGSGWNVVGTGDVNGDGLADIVFMHNDGRGYIYLMQYIDIIGGAGFLSAGSGWTVTHIADFDGDGKDDLVFRHADGRAHLFLMNGTTFGAGLSILGAGTGWTVTHVGDLNGDGKADLVFRHADGRAHARLMNGTSVVNAGDLLPAASGWRVTQLVDLNGDGKKDLVFRHDNGSITVRLMNGLAIVGSANLIGAGGWSVVP